MLPAGAEAERGARGIAGAAVLPAGARVCVRQPGRQPGLGARQPAGRPQGDAPASMPPLSFL